MERSSRSCVRNLDCVVRETRETRVADSDFDWEANERFTYCFPPASLPHYRYADEVPSFRRFCPAARNSTPQPFSFSFSFSFSPFIPFLLHFIPFLHSLFLPTLCLVRAIGSRLSGCLELVVLVHRRWVRERERERERFQAAAASPRLLTENGIHDGTWMKRNSTIRTSYFPAIRNRSPKFLVVFSETKFRRGRRSAVFRFSARSRTANPRIYFAFCLFPPLFFSSSAPHPPPPPLPCDLSCHAIRGFAFSKRDTNN